MPTVLKPQRGPQERFMATAADICIYGGAAGGGKTYGDGAYEGSNGLVFPVDAGVIGVLPLELCKENRDEYSDCGIIIDESGTVTFESEDGVFEIELPDGNRFTIDTKY